MTVLRPIEMKLIDELFGMYSGWVLNFSNKTFAEFFAHEIGVDIYDDAYAAIGTSKGKRLQAFLQNSQPAAVIKALKALWEYREADFISSGEPDPVKVGRERLSAVIERLGGQPLPPDPTAPKPTATAAPETSGPSESTLQALEDGFGAMMRMDDDVQARGYAFEGFLKAWFDAWDLKARGSFRVVGEQIDGSFEHRGSYYLLEAKWRNKQTDASDLRAFQEKVGDRLEGSRGLFVSYSGYTTEGLQAFTARRVVLMDGMDVYDALFRRISLEEVIAAKIRIAIEERRPYVSVRDLFPS